MADRYWVGGGSSASWNAIVPTNWGTASGVRDNASVPSTSDTVFFDSHPNADTPCNVTAHVNVGPVDFTGWANTITLTSVFQLRVYGSVTLSPTMTFTIAGTGYLYFRLSGTLTSGIPVPTMFTDSGVVLTLGSNLSFAAGQTLTVYGSLVMAGFIISGSSGIGVGRLLVTSPTLGSPKQIDTSSAGSGFANCDFRDITFANGGNNLDLSAITGGSGDCGGNTISGGGVLSFTTADDWYWYSASGGTYNLSDRTYWFTATNGGGTQMGADRGPLPQDMLYVDGSSINGTTTIDQDMPRMPGIDFTGCDAVAFHMNNVTQSIYGSFVIPAGVAITPGLNPGEIYLDARSAVVFGCKPSLTTNIHVRAIGGGVTLSENFTIGGILGYAILHEHGELDADTYNLSIGTYSGTGTNPRTLRMGSGTWSHNVGWNCLTTTNMSLFSEASTILFSAVWPYANTGFFRGGGLTYNNLSLVADGAYTAQVTIQGSNTFTGTVTINGPKTINFTAGTTQTVAALATTGTAIVLKSTTPGSPWYLVDPSGTNQVSNCTISDSYPRGSDAGGGALWLASGGTNTDAGGNVAYDGATNRGWKWTGFAPWLMRRRRRMAGAR